MRKSNHLLGKKLKKLYNPKTLKQTARGKVKLDDNELEKKLAKEMIISYCFMDENLKIGFKKNLESRNINHANSLL